MPASPEKQPLSSGDQIPSSSESADAGFVDADEASGNALDIALMMRVGDGDEQAFEQLIERHQSAVIGTVAKMLGNASDAEDIAQQVFLRIWKSAGRYQPTAKFTTFLFTITRNLVFNESRRRSRKKEYSINEREDDFHLQTTDAQTASPDDALLHDELQRAVDKAIAELPEKQRLAVVLRRYEGMPYDQIARILELSIPAVKSQLFRARNTLRESLQQYMDG
ncbi:MAG: sigma-70 family RNA polymerase sigma factor [Verrucomicrobiae bacterium]|nr:sigma-70 family RNA polymerase sigma factor [Verrucomicrobiae bacterium]NNJ86063.1 sigma-70 family RNA polymerase sigma factor [Akkermansiaceae bacterium]